MDNKLKTIDILTFIIALVAFCFGFYQNILGYASIAGGFLQSGILGFIVLMLLLGSSDMMHQALKYGKNGTANRWLLAYMIPAFVAFSGNFNAFFTISLQDDFLRRDLEEQYAQVGKLRNNIKTEWERKVGTLDQLLNSLKLQQETGFGPKCDTIVKKINKVLGYDMTDVMRNQPKEVIIEGYARQVEDAKITRWYKKEIEAHLRLLNNLQADIDSAKEIYNRSKAYTTLERVKNTFDRICSQSRAQMNEKTENAKPAVVCSSLVLHNPRTEEGKVLHAYRLAVRYPYEAFLPLFFSFLIDFAVPIILYGFYKRESEGYPTGRPF